MLPLSPSAVVFVLLCVFLFVLSVCWLVFVVSLCVVFAFFCRRRLRRLLLLLHLLLLGVFWSILGPLGVVLGASWCHLGMCFGHLGWSWAVLGPHMIFVRLGSSWGSMLAILGRLGGLLGSFWGVFWASCAVLSGLGAVSRAQDRELNFWCATWVDFWTVLGAQKGAQTTPRRHPDTPRRPKRWPRRSQRRPKIDQKIDLKNDRFLDPS